MSRILYSGLSVFSTFWGAITILPNCVYYAQCEHTNLNKFSAYTCLIGSYSHIITGIAGIPIIWFVPKYMHLVPKCFGISLLTQSCAIMPHIVIGFIPKLLGICDINAKKK